jgi:hypothetical protein
MRDREIEGRFLSLGQTINVMDATIFNVIGEIQERLAALDVAVVALEQKAESATRSVP